MLPSAHVALSTGRCAAGKAPCMVRGPAGRDGSPPESPSGPGLQPAGGQGMYGRPSAFATGEIVAPPAGERSSGAAGERSVPQGVRKAALARIHQGELCEVHHILSIVLRDWCPDEAPVALSDGSRTPRFEPELCASAALCGSAKFPRHGKPGSARPKKPCKFLRTPGGCRFGEECRFSHAKEGPQKATQGKAHPRRSPKHRSPE